MVFIPFVQLLPWWSNPTKLWCGLPLSSPEYAHVLTLNASGDGWGGVLDYNQSVQGLWTEPFRTWHINRLDMQAVWLALQHFNTSGLCYRVLLCWSEPTTPRLATLFTSSGALGLWSCVFKFGFSFIGVYHGFFQFMLCLCRGDSTLWSMLSLGAKGYLVCLQC